MLAGIHGGNPFAIDVEAGHSESGRHAGKRERKPNIAQTNNPDRCRVVLQAREGLVERLADDMRGPMQLHWPTSAFAAARRLN